ncbi:hypothetical protein EDB81DRAFT_866606 [Dactylonectria macrodidyma]|uniref:EthD domain-containing protein n=1 Tax=Dactylonectria macrodidyma TaxID=307937 RepID=A0A9P9JGT9_9HYPO|nr:hypothetical protein EDB81DRAFT_866606 [Dactylonectria macrodidyma]
MLLRLFILAPFGLACAVAPPPRQRDTELFPKQIVVVRRRSGLTHKEYVNYHAIVHGLKSWNGPRDASFPAAYIQDHTFDSAFGVNNSVPNQVYVGRDDVTELYGNSSTAFTSPPATNYTAEVTGPDGYNFNDLETAFSMLAYEKPVLGSLDRSETATEKNGSGPVVAFFWAAAKPHISSNDTFGAELANQLVALIPKDTLYRATVHVPVPGYDTRPYFGGYTMPTINAVVKLWLHRKSDAVELVRAAQLQLDSDALSLDQDVSFVVFCNEVVLWDSAKKVAFNQQRIQARIDRESY